MWEVVSRDSILCKSERIRTHDHFSRTSLEFEVCRRNVRSGFRLHPLIFKSEALILIEFTINSAKKLVFEPPVTVDLSFCMLPFMTSFTSLFFLRRSSLGETVVGHLTRHALLFIFFDFKLHPALHLLKRLSPKKLFFNTSFQLLISPECSSTNIACILSLTSRTSSHVLCRQYIS